MSINKYLFLGGPWHGRTQHTDGSPYLIVPETSSVSDYEDVTSVDYYISPFKTYTYNKRKFPFTVKDKYLFIYVIGSEEEVSNMFANFIISIFDMYVEA